MISYEYLWEDGSRYKRPTKLPAPDYVDALMNWAQALLDDESVFPHKFGGFAFLALSPHRAMGGRAPTEECVEASIGVGLNLPDGVFAHECATQAQR